MFDFVQFAEPNRAIGVRLGLIGFLFGFVRLDRLGGWWRGGVFWGGAGLRKGEVSR